MFKKIKICKLDMCEQLKFLYLPRHKTCNLLQQQELELKTYKQIALQNHFIKSITKINKKSIKNQRSIMKINFNKGKMQKVERNY